MNHSPRFWELLAGLDPQARQNDRRLDRIGPSVMTLGRERAASSV